MQYQTIASTRSSQPTCHSPPPLQVDVQVIVTDTLDTDVDKLEYQRPAYVAVGLIMAMTAFSILFPLIVTSRAFGLDEYTAPTKPCLDPCA